MSIFRRTVDRWFNTLAFTLRAAGTFGNEGRATVIAGPEKLGSIANQELPLKRVFEIDVPVVYKNRIAIILSKIAYFVRDSLPRCERVWIRFHFL
jgi:hypothetical protein